MTVRKKKETPKVAGAQHEKAVSNLNGIGWQKYVNVRTLSWPSWSDLHRLYSHMVSVRSSSCDPRRIIVGKISFASCSIALSFVDSSSIFTVHGLGDSLLRL